MTLRKDRRRFLARAAAAFSVVGAAPALARLPSENTAFGRALGVVATPAPPPPAPILYGDGRRSSMGSYRGRVALAVFWATWCPVCASEMPKLDALQRRYGGRLAVLPLSLDFDGPRGTAEEAVRRFYRRRGVGALPVLFDENEFNADMIGVRQTPTTLVIDKRGLVVGLIEGAAPWETPEASAYLEGLMAA